MSKVSWWSRRKGVVIAIAAVALIALLGMAALAIDVGQLCVAAQVCQDTVDAAALAAASQLPDLTKAGAEAGLYVAANNEGHGFQVELGLEDGFSGVVHYGPGETVPSYGQLDSKTHALEVTGQVEVAYAFAKIFGLESGLITRSGTAIQEPGDIPTTIFADSETEHSIVFSGDGLEVTGLVHSNGGIDVTGNNAMFHNPVEYFNVLRDPSGTTTYQGGCEQHEKREWPIDYTASDFEPYDYIIDGDWEPTTANLTLAPGNYFVNGNVKFRGDYLVAEDCTIVATGNIHLAGNAPRFSPHDKDVSLYSLQGNISATASGGEVDGILFAPNGHIDYLGGGQRVVSLIAQTVSFYGDDINITGVPGTSLLSKVRLIK